MGNWTPLTQTQCVLKWGWSSIYLFNGGWTASCFSNPYVKIDPDNFGNFHNLSKKLEDRNLMLQGQWPTGCNTCKVVEDVGASSDRIIHNRFQHLVPDVMKQNPDSIESYPTVVEIAFKNTCNMSCIYCAAKFSSKIASEMNQFGEFKKDGVEIPNVPYNEINYEKLRTEFWKWLESNITKIRELVILGGEPFLLDETYELFEFIDKNPNSKLDLTLISNLNIPTSLMKKTVDNLTKLIDNKKLKSIKISASIDGWDKSIEFQRYGLSLELFEKNLLYILNNTKLKLNINFTATCLSIPSMVPLLKEWIKWNSIRPVDLSGGHVLVTKGQQCLELDTLPASFLLPYISQAVDIIPKEPKFNFSRSRVEMLKEFIENKNSIGDKIKLKQLKIYIDEISKRRNIDWRNYYPWLESFFE